MRYVRYLFYLNNMIDYVGQNEGIALHDTKYTNAVLACFQTRREMACQMQSVKSVKCEIVHASRDNHVNFYTNIYCCYNEHTDELLAPTQALSQYSSLLCIR
jgi:hypothetical protein